MERLRFVRARLLALRAVEGQSCRKLQNNPTVSEVAEKSIKTVIPSEARDPSWFKCPQKEGFLVASLLGMTAILTFFATSLGAEECEFIAGLQ
jgi:hypothetical protein